ncbi:hypothetical protein [Citrobacter sedlakii]|uniref:hypothetical protein n=1 Tax=Citrobacter sedlakii TaxID=67826 RepID=UPI0033147650|nr:hypothetical protein [Salmonella enterica subsp. enterica serovar Livingstone]EHA3170163.1 hypothetical protein [Salmonella enterica subsp. enterica serovar Livingstone]
MCSVTSIQQVKWQRHADMEKLKDIDAQIAEAERAVSLLAERRRELVNRLGLNKPDGPEAA